MTANDMVNSLFSQAQVGVVGWMGDLFVTYSAIFGIFIIIFGAGLITAAIRGSVGDNERPSMAGFEYDKKKGPWLDDRWNSLDYTSDYNKGGSASEKKRRGEI